MQEVLVSHYSRVQCEYFAKLQIAQAERLDSYARLGGDCAEGSPQVHSLVKHHLTQEYLERVGRFAAVYPSAHAFLRRVEHDGPAQALWLSTAVNAHLYKDAGFLAYVKLKNPDLKPPSLVISPKFNQQIASDTSDESRRLFPNPFGEVLAKYGGVRAGWAVPHAGGATELTVLTPTAFFEDLFERLVSLNMHGAGRAVPT